ncbi:MAG: hypothetical protein KIS92_07780 [Planctomycetota bacterium]|nr:hypothetical protein [Planctomycetota bacterium]
MDGADFHHALSKMFGYGKRVSNVLPQRLPPILIVTGYFDEEEVQRLVFGERIVGILRKPVHCEKLIEIADDLHAYESTRRDRRAKAISRLSDRLVKAPSV